MSRAKRCHIRVMAASCCWRSHGHDAQLCDIRLIAEPPRVNILPSGEIQKLWPMSCLDDTVSSMWQYTPTICRIRTLCRVRKPNQEGVVVAVWTSSSRCSSRLSFDRARPTCATATSLRCDRVTGRGRVRVRVRVRVGVRIGFFKGWGWDERSVSG